jgi:hypothetical protein
MRRPTKGEIGDDEWIARTDSRTILFNVFCHRRDLSSGSELSGAMDAQLKGEWLRMTISFSTPEESSTDTRQHFEESVFSSLCDALERGAEVPQLRLPVSRNLAYWHQVDETRHGLLSMRPRHGALGDRFVLSIPVRR